MILKVPIAFGYAPEERFNFKINDGSINQIFFYEDCSISAKFRDEDSPPEANSEETLELDIVNEKLGNPKVSVSHCDDLLLVKVKLSRGTANFYCKFELKYVLLYKSISLEYS